MPDITEPDHSKQEKINKRQWLWFIGLYVAGLIVTAVVVYALRWVVKN